MTTITTLNVGTNEICDFMQSYDGTTLMVKSFSVAYVVNVAAATAQQITSPNYPAKTCRGLVYLDGGYYVMDIYGTIYGSDPDAPLVWNALNFLSAETEPDGGVCLAKSNQYVIAFGNYTTEFFFDAQNATGSPLAPVQNGAIQYGCANGNSVGYADGAFYFLSQSKAQGQSFSYGFQIGVIKGLQYQRISTDSVERILNADGCATVYGSAVSMLGHTFYTLALVTTGITIAFDVDTQQWYYFTTQTAGTAVTLTTLTSATNVDGTTVTATATKVGHGFSDGDPLTIAGAGQAAYNITTNVTVTSADTFTYQIPSIPVTPATGTITATGITSGYFPLLSAANYGTAQLFQHISNGGIYQLSDTTYTDATVLIDAHIRTARIDNENTAKKFCAWMDLVTDRSSNNALVRYTDDDYQNYSKYRKVSLSNTRSRLNRQGQFIRRAFEIRVTDNAAFRFQGIDLGLEQGVE